MTIESLDEDIEIYAQNIVDTVREPLLILDAALRVRSANRAFYHKFHVSPKETEGRLIYELGNGQWDTPDLRTLLEDIVPKSSVFENFELEHTFPIIGRRVMLLNARKLESGRHGELLVLAMEDVTPRKRAEEALLQAGALQVAIFNSANFSSIATDANGVIQIFNVGAEKMLGYTAADVMNKITPADISDPQEVIARAKALSVELGTQITPGFEALVFKASRGIEDIYELTYIRKDGSRFPAVVSVTALRDVGNTIIGYLLIGTDNTARKQAEEALVKAGALQSAIFNSANFSSIATDAKGVIQIFNVGAEKMLGYTAAEVMNKITPADISDPQEVIARAKALSVELQTPITPGFEALVFKASRGIEDIYELTYIRKDGSRFPAVVSVTALRDVANTIIGYLLIGTDNTARKQVEAERMLLDQAVRDQQFYTRSLIESNIDALMATDPRGIITDVNKQMEALTGCTRDELIGAPFKDYFTDPARAEAAIKLVLSEGKVTDYELTARARDGKETVVSYNATTFHDRDRKLRGVFAAARDVTERKRYEESLQEADRRKNEFLAMLAHELRNPLAPMRNALQIMRLKASREIQRPEDKAIQSASAMMERQVGQMVRLVDDLLDVSRISRGKIELRRGRIELGSAIHHAAEAVRPQCESMGHTLTVTVSSLPIYLNADPTRLAQVLGNLLNNACKYTRNGGKMSLTVERQGNRAEIRLRDNGIGIAADQLPRIFEMFVQIDTTLERSVSGLGIGLTLVKNLVEMHEGTVEVQSDGLGHGSEFVVRLPIMVETPESLIPVPSVGSLKVTIARRILVVDDNRDSATSLAELLGLTGHTTAIAYDGLEAVETAETFMPEAVLLDIGLPKLNGFDVCRKIREQPWGKTMMIVALTGWGQEEDRLKSKEAGFDGHLVKPVDIDNLMKLLDELPKRAS